VEILPFPSFSEPVQTAVAVRCIDAPWVQLLRWAIANQHHIALRVKIEWVGYARLDVVSAGPDLRIDGRPY
jgi:hypothetical protein